MVRQYNRILEGRPTEELDLSTDDNLWSLLPLWAWITIGAVVLVAIALAVIITVVCCIRRRRHSDGYTVGKEIYATSHVSRP